MGKLVGGAFGAGGKRRIAEATEHLAKNFANGDTIIDIIGFSRGAALALHFANVISGRGVKYTKDGSVVREKPKVRFLGLWDAVASFGIPFNLGPIKFQRINVGYHLTLPSTVEHAFHVLALDERRQAFRPTRVRGAYEVWFRGVHGDIGAGENPGLNNITLRWMLRKAIAIGIDIDRSKLEQVDANSNPVAQVSENLDPVKQRMRKVFPRDRIHYTVMARDGCNNPPEGNPRETKMDEQCQIVTAAC